MLEYLEQGGLRAGLVIAGFVGSIVSLTFVRGLTPLGAIGAILIGVASAVYLTPVAVEGFDLSRNAENGLAFGLGLFGMNLVGGVFRLSERFRAKPLETLNSIRRGHDDD